jgi:hypothetical protein
MNYSPASARSAFVALAARRAGPGAGSATHFLKTRTTRARWPNLDEVLAPLPWAVAGAVATRLYMPERATQDLDVAVAANQATESRRRLTQAGFTYKGELSIGGASWVSPKGVAIDVLEGHEEWWPEALQSAQENRDAQGLPILPLPYLALMKFQASRLQDLADVSRMLGQASEESLSRVRALFAHYVSAEDLQDLESLITLGRMELTA